MTLYHRLQEGPGHTRDDSLLLYGADLKNNPKGHLQYAPESQYSSKENPHTNPRITEKVDIWGIGAIIWYLMTLEDPNKGPASIWSGVFNTTAVPQNNIPTIWVGKPMLFSVTKTHANHT